MARLIKKKEYFFSLLRYFILINQLGVENVIS
jgi:hypothetical protein